MVGWIIARREVRRGNSSVRSPLRRAPLLATPIAKTLQGGRPERPGLLFLKLRNVSARCQIERFMPLSLFLRCRKFWLAANNITALSPRFPSHSVRKPHSPSLPSCCPWWCGVVLLACECCASSTACRRAEHPPGPLTRQARRPRPYETTLLAQCAPTKVPASSRGLGFSHPPPGGCARALAPADYDYTVS